eukprot:11838834-Alexandrium_andersonii.AAC.1
MASSVASPVSGSSCSPPTPIASSPHGSALICIEAEGGGAAPSLVGRTSSPLASTTPPMASSSPGFTPLFAG